ncbi:DM13 domain-containing protein [Motiliproteus sp. MSK22-1]|uniref:DM13 domain-containing protein n=1 Tax=Motiliproteus sp. MSK22-1 TaxID=1897630 RepID=UPI000978D0EF|nr:DM13 domain-containing protein [Motiliproteus sp. MSK22-1]OMH36144.1 hypothetical protein BGP75_10355 [Motiliproteus sp. MSK22-1]
MKKRFLILLVVTHLLVGVVGFGAGIYALPILIAPPAPSESEIKEMSSQAQYSANFRKDLMDSDALHWGEGKVTIGSTYITLMGEVAPGPDYKLYLSTEFVETEADFKRLKTTMAHVGEVKTFNNFVVAVPPDIDPSRYNTIIIWCETFGEFITSAKYQ